jgi:hypothetical protein
MKAGERMKIKKIKTKVGKRRNVRASADYIITDVETDEHGGDELDAEVSAIATQPTGSRVVTSGAINTMADDFDGGRKELELLDRSYHGRGDTAGHYVLSWRPTERPSQDQKMQSIEITLKNLGYHNHACVWVEHGDKPHSHIHLLVSRLDPEADTPRIGGAGASVGFVTTRAGVTRHRDHEELSLARAEAEICREHGWEPTPNALYGPDLELTKRPGDPNRLTLRPRALDYEARHNRPHPTRILGEAAITSLRNATSWDEAHVALAEHGVVLERVKKGSHGREGAILRSGQTRLRLSALPADLALKKLDKRWGTPVSGKQKPVPPVAGSLSLHAAVAKPISAQFSPQQVKNELKCAVSNAASWEDFLCELQRHNWSLERSGGGALIVAGEHRIKLSQIPGRPSYAILCNKWGEIENSNLSDDVLRIVSYHEAIATPVSPASPTPKIKTARPRDTLSLPPWALETKKQAGRLSKEQALATEAQKIIRNSIQSDTSIEATLSRLDCAGFSTTITTFEASRGRQFVSGIKLQKQGIIISLNDLPDDCNKLRKIGMVFGEIYTRPLPKNLCNSKSRPNCTGISPSIFIAFLKQCVNILCKIAPFIKNFEVRPKRHSNHESTDEMTLAQRTGIVEFQKQLFETQRIQQAKIYTHLEVIHEIR